MCVQEQVNSNQFIIIMKGFTATGKSTLANKLIQLLDHTIVLHSAVIRRELGLEPDGNQGLKYEFRLDDFVFIENVSKKVYKEMIDRCVPSLNKGENVILDAAYNFLWQRELVYDAVNSFNNIKIIVLQCIIDDEEEIKYRLKKRASNDDALSEADSWQTYLSTKTLSEPIQDSDLFQGKRVPIIFYDTNKNKIASIDNFSLNINFIVDVLEREIS